MTRLKIIALLLLSFPSICLAADSKIKASFRLIEMPAEKNQTEYDINNIDKKNIDEAITEFRKKFNKSINVLFSADLDLQDSRENKFVKGNTEIVVKANIISDNFVKVELSFSKDGVVFKNINTAGNRNIWRSNAVINESMETFLLVSFNFTGGGVKAEDNRDNNIESRNKRMQKLDKSSGQKKSCFIEFMTVEVFNKNNKYSIEQAKLDKFLAGIEEVKTKSGEFARRKAVTKKDLIDYISKEYGTTNLKVSLYLSESEMNSSTTVCGFEISSQLNYTGAYFGSFKNQKENIKGYFNLAGHKINLISNIRFEKEEIEKLVFLTVYEIQAPVFVPFPEFENMNLRITLDQNGMVNLAWNDNEEFDRHYILKYKIYRDSVCLTDNLDGYETSYIDIDTLEKGKTYKYTVVMVDNDRVKQEISSVFNYK
ncbi:MAG: hypothetical protein A2231_03000 [Candidatus Firestonebacteria bacterium RIFOXYA2_FULL_40_8]|nr:MAG: hypothetical protein A2231_03000 [Candidatus Firestonebacteria bacterium RIFOXYA2_FULL_40_8]